MIKLINKFKKRFSRNNDKLLIVDGDNTHPKKLLTILKPSDFAKIEIFCDTNNHKKWINCHEFYDISFRLCNPAKDAVDKALITRLLKLALEISHNNNVRNYPGGIFIVAENDYGYRDAISSFSQKYSTVVVSRAPFLLDIPSLKDSISIPKQKANSNKISKTTNESIHQIVKQGMSLSTVGLLLKSKGISYKQLAPLLTAQGFILDSDNMKVIQVPMIN